MIGTFENPTLDLDPSDPDTLDVITATRSGVATYTDEDGLIQSASADTVRVDYTQGEELTPTKFQNIGYTDFSSGWAAYLGTTALGAGYDSQASLVCSFTGNGQAYQYFTSVEGVTYTGSFWARAVSGSGPYRLVHGNSASGTSTSITLTSEWQFFSAQFLGRSGGGDLYFGIGAQSGDSVEIAMPQVEEGTTASDFVENTTGSPKFIASATYGPRVPMILVEPSATNLVAYSEDFSNAQWLKNIYGTGVAATVNSDVAISPDGTQNADKVIFDVGSGTTTGDSVTLEDYISVTQGETYTFSVYLKGEQGGEQVLVRHAGSAGYTTLTLTDEWVKYEVTETAIYNYAYVSLSLRQGLGGVIINPTATFYIWGAQFEQGSVATSYIPTSGGDAAANTRQADDLVISGSDFTDFYNDSEGTFYLEGVPQNLTDDTIYWMDTAPSSERIAIYDTVANAATIYVDGISSSSATVYPPNQLARLAISVKSNFQELSINGGTSVTLGVSSLPSPTSLHIGSRYSSSNYLNGHIKRLIYWPTHSSRL